MKVNFKKIAILDKKSLSSILTEDCSEEEIISQVKKWQEKAIKHGMDACYLRLYDVPQEKIDIIVKTLSVSTKLIIPSSVELITNDISGIHFRENDEIIMPKNSKNLLKGKSCHSLDSIKKAEEKGLDYVFFSPIFKTATHPDAKAVGLDELKRVCNLTKIPIFALGGINEQNYIQCLNAGAYGVAAISMFLK